MNLAKKLTGMGINPFLATFLVSMVPVVELRGAIPVGAGLGVPIWLAALISVVGNMLPVPFILLFIRPVFAWMKCKSSCLGRLVEKLEARAEKKSEKVRKGEFWGLLFFVAIPLPGTGAWTGALIASMLNMRLKNALPPIFCGVVIAGVIVSLATAGVIQLLV